MTGQLLDLDGSHIPTLGFGTWRLYEEDCRRSVADALAIGYRHLDTAQSYENEAQVGRALRESGVDRDDVFLVTKLRRGNGSADAVGASTEASLRALGTDRVDALLIHWPEPDQPIEETLEAMVALRDRGLTRHIGVCNFPASLVRRALEVCRLAMVQVEYHPLLTQDELLALCDAHDMAFTAYAPIARGAVFDDPVVVDIAAAHGVTAAQVAIRWLLQQPRVIAIPKSGTTARIEENFDVHGLRLTTEEMARLSARGGAAGRVVNPPHAPDWEREVA